MLADRNIYNKAYVGDSLLRKLGDKLLFLSGEPVVGIGVPFPPVVVVYVLSNPFPGEGDRLLFSNSSIARKLANLIVAQQVTSLPLWRWTWRAVISSHWTHGATKT